MSACKTHSCPNTANLAIHTIPKSSFQLFPRVSGHYAFLLLFCPNVNCCLSHIQMPPIRDFAEKKINTLQRFFFILKILYKKTGYIMESNGKLRTLVTKQDTSETLKFFIDLRTRCKSRFQSWLNSRFITQDAK